MTDFKCYINLNDLNSINLESKNSVEKNDSILFLDGAILNKRELINKYANNDFYHLIYTQYLKKGISFFDELQGEFNGYLFDKINKKFVLFTNHQASRKVFYTFQNNVFIASNTLKKLVDLIDKNNLTKSLYLEAAYSLLITTNILENNTLIKEIKKLQSAECIKIDLIKNTFSLQKYFDFKNINPNNKSLLKNAEEFNLRFQKAIKQEYEYDRDLNKKSIAFLSGGLDSRVNILSALQQNFKIDNVVCFSEENYLDHTISKQIAKDNALNYNFIPFKNINFIKNIAELSSTNEYLVYYTGSSHVNYALQQLSLNFNAFGLIHSGQIGDGVLGGFNSSKNINLPNISSILFSTKLGSKITPYLNKTVKKYPTEELFSLQNIAFNRAVAGSYVVENYNTLVSPFLHPEVLKYALEIHPKYKYNHHFYFYWIKNYIPQATNYIWETTLMKPTKLNGKFIGTQFLKRLYNYSQIILGKSNKINMIPYSYYYNKDASIKNYFNQYFNQRIDTLTPYPELKLDVIKLFNIGSFKEKVLVLTLISGINDLFK